MLAKALASRSNPPADKVPILFSVSNRMAETLKGEMSF